MVSTRPLRGSDDGTEGALAVIMTARIEPTTCSVALSVALTNRLPRRDTSSYSPPSFYCTSLTGR